MNHNLNLSNKWGFDAYDRFFQELLQQVLRDPFTCRSIYRRRICRYGPPERREKSFKEGRRITLNEVREEPGISRPTLTRISNVPGYNTKTDTISALRDYFEIEPGESLKRGDLWAQASAGGDSVPPSNTAKTVSNLSYPSGTDLTQTAKLLNSPLMVQSLTIICRSQPVTVYRTSIDRPVYNFVDCWYFHPYYSRLSTKTTQTKALVRDMKTLKKVFVCVMKTLRVPP